MKPAIVIVGAGALGKCLAALLADNAVITLCERNPVTARALRKGGFIFKEKKRVRNIHVRMVSSLAQQQAVKTDILIFATKVMDLRTAVRDAAALQPRCVFLPQNGLFDFGWVKRSFRTASICRGVTTMACRESGPLEAALFYRGEIYAGGPGATLAASFFRTCKMRTSVYRDPNQPVWAKLIFSAVMNPLPVITGRGYDVLKTDPEIWKLVRQAIEEGRAVAGALGVRLAFDPLRLIRRVRDGDLAGIAHKGSIFQDVADGRPTELDFITGEIVRQARQLGLMTPALVTILARARALGA